MIEIANYFDQRAETWDSMYSELNPAQGAVAMIAGVSKGSRVLDLGCGTGVMAPVYLEAKARQVVALDLSPRMIEIARSKYSSEPMLDFRCEDAYRFEDEEGFDAAVIYNAYPHFLEKEALAEKIASLLVPGGRFIVAHGMGREMMNRHHANVPADVTSHLHSASMEASVWKPWFEIDSLVDAPRFYCFSGALR